MPCNGMITRFILERLCKSPESNLPFAPTIVDQMTRRWKSLDKFRRSGEERLETVLDGAVPHGHRQMSLSSAGLTVQNQ